VRSLCGLNLPSYNEAKPRPFFAVITRGTSRQIWPTSEKEGLAVSEKSTSGWLARNASQNDTSLLTPDGATPRRNFGLSTEYLSD